MSVPLKQKNIFPTGDHNLKANDNTEQEFNITDVIVHIGYNSITNDNDVALLRLSGNATINDHVNTICLPKPAGKVPVGTRCKITGWGATDEHAGKSNILMEAEVPIVNRSVCAHEKIYGDKITKNMMCGGFARGGIDTCQGDSGGPMQCRNSEDRSQWVLQGVTSWGRGCGRKLKYGVYAIVRNYLGWIKNMKDSFKRKPEPSVPAPQTDGPKTEPESGGGLPTTPTPEGNGGKQPTPRVPVTHGNKAPTPPVPSGNGDNIPKPPVPSGNGENIPKHPVPSGNGDNIPKPPVPGSSGSGLPKPSIPGSNGNNIPQPPVPGLSESNVQQPPVPAPRGNNIPMPPLP